jgi:cell division septation protein DedD
MNNITVTVELCAEDRARLDNILEALTRQERPAEHPVETFAEALQAPETTTPTEPEKPAVAEAEPEAPAVTRDELQAFVLQLCAAGKNTEARAIVREYAARVSLIPEDKLAEAMTKLRKLGG